MDMAPRYDIRTVGAANAVEVAVAAQPSVGAHGNAWNGVAVAANGVSAALDTLGTGTVSAFGNASAATTITVQVSQNNLNWYDTVIAQTLASGGDFALHAALGARYVRLRSSGAATITATLAGSA
jgi:hypothetical protein